jgi:superfamily II DNA or RNA helicase
VTTLALEFLTALEEREMRLLAWGYVDNTWTADEIADLADEFVLEHDDTGVLSGADITEALTSQALLLAVDGGLGESFRTRMAETVRLFARLRQLFPKHRDALWTQAATLVSDFRIISRPRAYPKRDVAVADAIAEITSATASDAAREAAMQALLTRRGSDTFQLSRFQVDATVDVLRGLGSARSGGTIVGAGTGSGKTLAFYLPALTHVVSATSGNGTRVLAIYPRIELLRDQFAEAFREARRLDGVGRLGRPIRLGALYGGTPHRPKGADRLWKARGADRICPYMLCPECGEGTLIWTRHDIDAGIPRLRCEKCFASVGPERMSLTRDQMRAEPPDVLFTTTEMLNRTLMDGRMRHLVGVGRGGMPIDLVLLDEVHTYEGTTGAQVAGVLRRWRHARRKPVHFVGLSATLGEAAGFFADLTGLPPQNVTSIEPRVADMEQEGQEYMIAARADPYSGASVLSTTIQTAMLMQRALDPLTDPPSEGAFGQRLFTFTDDLDVTNRLYFDLLDAEGLNSWGNPEKPSLAALRNPIGGDLQARRAAGQLWDALEPIGHRLDEATHTRIGRTTSQDADVDRLANAIVATASLEVGFNDPRVGAVLQHKAPHGAAPFLQRKGRAGRNRTMRPWTLVVLSDFGRDRSSYQSYERLFDPELAARSLPIANPAVVRMQAVFALLDWLVDRVTGEVQVWPLLQRPAGTGQWQAHDLERQAALAKEMERVLTEDAVRDDLAIHLKRALGCSETAVDEIFWQPPRPLLTTVLPTAIRRLRSQWRHLTLGANQDYVADGPLPEFVVSRLFADLALPEITVVTPSQTKHEDERREQMRAVQALNAYAPGRVSHRLTVSHRYARHWIAPGDAVEDLDICLVAAEFEELGIFGRGSVHESRVVRPLTLQVAVPPPDVLSSSHGRLRWRSEIVPSAGSDQSMAPPGTSPLVDLVEAITFFTHGALAHVEVRRWANESEFETHTSAGTRRGVVRFVNESGGSGPVAIGLAIDVDALAIDIHVPDRLLSGRTVAPEHMRGLRIERFRERMLGSEAAARLGQFNTERVVDGAIRALVSRGLATKSDLETVYHRLRAEDGLGAAIFADARGYADDDRGVVSTGLAELRAALEDGTPLDALDHAVPALWEEIDESWDGWAGGRLATTVGALVHSALQELCPEYDAEEVVVDIEAGQRTGMLRVWLSEQTIGGGGLVQESLRRIGDSPRTFFDLIVAAAEPSIDEMVDDELARIARLATGDTRVGEALADVRGATHHHDRTSRFQDLLEVLRAAGVFVCHPVVSAMSVRALRPGSDERIDRTIIRLLGDWDELEATFGVDLDLRTYAALRANDPMFDQTSGMSAPAEHTDAWRAGQITGLLWQRGAALCAQALRAPNPFVTLPRPDPRLLRACLRPGERPVDVGEISVALASDGPLARNGELDVRAGAEDARLLRQALLSAACTAIEAGPLIHYPRAAGVRRDAHGLRARLVLDLVGE